jgi:hypothetical protein
MGIGCLLLVSNFIDFQSLLTKVIFGGSKKVINKESTFLEIIGLWYQLKVKCDTINLNEASDKLDEVFPLLNKALEDDQVN